jgi:bacteriocin-like protein
MVRAGCKEKDMSKTNDTTKTRELTEAELAAVSGGSKDDTPVESISFFRLAPAPFSIDIGTSENLVARRS